MAAHRRKFQVDGLWKLHNKGKIGEVYQQCRKTLWHVDTLLKERLKSQNSVKTSLLQALFSELKVILSSEVVKVLKDIKMMVDEADVELEGLNLDHFMDRIVVYVVTGANMLLCAITIYLFVKVKSDIIMRIDQVLQRAGIRIEESRPLLGAPVPVLPPANSLRVTQNSSSSRAPLDRIRSQGIAAPGSS